VQREARIEDISVSAYKVSTDAPESDGTFAWDSTTIIIVDIAAGGLSGMGYTYADAAAGKLIRDTLAPVIRGRNPFDIPGCWQALTAAVRNNGDTGLCRMAIAAIDTALWDLKAKLAELPLARLLGMVRATVPCYGSGGFTSYTIERLQQQLGGWAQDGFTMVKMKIGRHPAEDFTRMAAARAAIGDKVELFVDANGAYSCGQALRIAAPFPDLGVTWYEQPIRPDDLEGMRYLRQRVPPGVELTSGEYIFESDRARRIVEAEAVDVLQADATRCGITGFLQAASLCEARGLPLSSHCAPSLHLHVCCALPAVRHMEYFHDHARIEQMFFEGAAKAENGMLAPNLDTPGMGLEFNRCVASGYEIEI
jgi:L-alanine-DL-glutamate epimerase-like enolase superfamily enzyme